MLSILKVSRSARTTFAIALCAVAANAQVPTVVKTFNPTAIIVGNTSTVSITITNPATTTATALAISDMLPTGLVFAAPSNLAANCGGVAVAATGPPAVLSLTGGSLNSAASCVVSADVVGTTQGTFVNITGTVSASTGTGGTGTATLTVVAPPTFTKTFGTSVLQMGSNTTLTFTLTNPAGNPVPFTNLSFTDTLPAGLLVATPNGLTNSCGGTATATAGTNGISLTGGTLAAGSTCTIALNVTGTTVGTQNNISSNLTDDQGVYASGATATVAVVTPPTITKAFADSQIELNFIGTTLSFTITNPAANPVPLTGVAVTDVLPDGVVLATPDSGLNTAACPGATITAPAGGNTITVSNGTIAPGASCIFSVQVLGSALGTFTNTTGNVTANGPVTGGTATAVINVVDQFFMWFFEEGGGGSKGL